MKDAFERRAYVKQRFLGPVSTSSWGTGYDNWRRLLDDGYAVRVFLGDREVGDYSAADPDARSVTVSSGVLKGDVEVRVSRLERSPQEVRT